MRIFMSNKIAVITGASRGIGRAITLKYAQMGYDVAICCHHNKERLEETAKEVRSMQVRCLTYVGNIGNYNDACTFFHEIETKLGSIDILINNAGISHIGLLQDMSIEEWNQVLNTNLTSAFSCSKYAIPDMITRNQGKIINISSIWGCSGASCEVAYSASKGGLNLFTQALAKELAPSNIQVNAIACGVIDTRMNACFDAEERSELENEIPAGRFAAPSEVADFVQQLIDAPSYLTGQIISFDGGYL